MFFFHIAKTGGTSLTDAIRRRFPKRDLRSERGNLSLAYAEALMAQRSDRCLFIHGHPAAGVGAALAPHARTVTMLRDPIDHCVSNYLFIRGDPANPDQAAALRLGLSDFLRAHPYHAAFQAGSLLVGMGAGTPIERFGEAVPAIEAFLRTMALVGTAERSDAFIGALAEVMAWPSAPRLRRLRRAKADPVLKAELRAERIALEQDAELAPLFAVERRVYALAQAVAER